MFKDLIALLRKGDLVSQAIEDADRMFEYAKKLYKEVISVIKEEREASFDIYQLDQKINNKEKSIRRKLMENMSFNPRQDIVASLTLTSVIIDVERIGDYSKNIFELAQRAKKKKGVKIDIKLFSLADDILVHFDQSMNALTQGDETGAKKIMVDLDEIKKGIDDYIDDQIMKADCDTGEAVINSLYARYLKRIAAHLSNIASSIANPFNMIGFFDDESGKEAD